MLARMLLSLGLPEPDRTAFWSPETVDTAPHDGNGLGLLDVRTDRHGTTLQVMLDGVGYPRDTGVDAYDGPDRLAGPGTAVQEVVVGNVFEGQHGAFLGVREPLPSRVLRLSDPARVVIDVAHSAGD